MRIELMRTWAYILALIACMLRGTVASTVALARVNGAISPATAAYLARAIDEAASEKDQCLVIELDTPGGLLQSTKEIVQSLYAAELPVAVYVSPPGATAASAGVFITLAADVAAMAPHTTIGAAHPLELGGISQNFSTNDVFRQKMENYASAFIEGIAEKRHRNAAWAREAVIHSQAVTSEKALQMGVIDILATNLPDLLAQLNGRQVQGRTLQTLGVSVHEIPVSMLEQTLEWFWQPELMSLLLLVVIYGFISELSHPGALLPGVAAVLALILLLYMSATLPMNIAGLALILLAIALLVADAYAPSHGVLTVGGIASFFIGSLMLFNHAPPGFQLSMTWITSTTMTTAAFFLFFVSKGIRAQFLPAKTGPDILLGRSAPIHIGIDRNKGTVFIEGELWSAESSDPIEDGCWVVITGRRGLTLLVKPLKSNQKETSP